MKTNILAIVVSALLLLSAMEGKAQRIRHEHWKLRTVDITGNYADNGLTIMKAICLSGGTAAHSIALGILSSSNDQLLSGAEICYKHNLLPESENTNIYLSLLGQFNFSIPLRESINVLVHPKDFVGEYERFNTLDFGAGFGLKQYLSQSISIWASIYYDYYKREIIPSEDRRITDFSRFSADSGTTINLKLGLSIEF